jgi:hypothetical protein
MLFTCIDDMFLSRCNSKSRRKSQANVERGKRRMQAHCAMKAKMKLDGDRNHSALLITKWFRSVLRRVKDAKVTLEEQPESEGKHEVRIYHYRVIVIFTFKIFILIRLTLHHSLTYRRRRPCKSLGGASTPGSIPHRTSR